MPSSQKALNLINRQRHRDNTENDKFQNRRGQGKWNMGIWSYPVTFNVPADVKGTVLLLADHHEKPSFIEKESEQISESSPDNLYQKTGEGGKKKTLDGQIVLEPQPEDCCNDPLNWSYWKKDAALFSISIYSMLGGGMTPILAAGFNDVASTFDISISQVPLSTGLYMLGLGLGSVISSPTAILFGKRPVYLLSAILLIATSAWCALSSNFTSLLLARILQGMAASAVECLPSASISEMYFLHERAYRIGIYSLLLIGGKNLVPLVSAVIIQNLDWRWVFWITVIVAALCGTSLFLLVPETFWDRSNSNENLDLLRESRISLSNNGNSHNLCVRDHEKVNESLQISTKSETAQEMPPMKVEDTLHNSVCTNPALDRMTSTLFGETSVKKSSISLKEDPSKIEPSLDQLNQNEKKWTTDHCKSENLYRDVPIEDIKRPNLKSTSHYVVKLRNCPKLSYTELLKPWNGRLTHSSWLKLATRPFILFAYPAVLWSALMYACSVGWLIVISETVTLLFRSETTYGFSALSTGLIYISPLIGGILGTAIAGKVSDIIVKSMARLNNKIYEPEFRLVMAVPTAITTVIGLIGLGWSVQKVDSWIVPTVFFGVVSFGCSLGATTAITFCVDSYHAYAGETLVVLNFSKNIFHGLVFSLFINNWFQDVGPKAVFVWLGIIQLFVMALTVPMYIFGKRARIWTFEMNLTQRF